jgi:triacylglycerol lipase
MPRERQASGSLARGLRIELGLELSVYLVAGATLALVRGWTLASLLALAAGFAAAWRALLGLATYALAWLWAAGPPAEGRASLGSLLLGIAGELVAIFGVYFVLQPFEATFMGPAGPPPGSARRLPVLLVHGYVCNRGLWLAFARALRGRGESVWAVSFEPVYASIDAWVPELADRIDELRATSGRERVVLVGHSMGGLAARAYLRARGPAAVAALVTLGSPHHGSRVARLGLGRNAREMEPGSRWLAELLAADRDGVGTRFLSVFSHHDSFVVPQRSSEHPAARNVALSGVGHLSLPFSARVQELVKGELDAVNAGEPPA